MWCPHVVSGVCGVGCYHLTHSMCSRVSLCGVGCYHPTHSDVPSGVLMWCRVLPPDTFRYAVGCSHPTHSRNFIPRPILPHFVEGFLRHQRHVPPRTPLFFEKVLQEKILCA